MTMGPYAQHAEPLIKRGYGTVPNSLPTPRRQAYTDQAYGCRCSAGRSAI